MKAAKAILDQLAKYQKEEVIEMHRDKIKKLERNSQVQKISNWKRSLKVDANPIVLNPTIKENKEIKPLTKYEE